MISEKDLERILDRYLKGTATDEEIRLVDKWYSALDAENDFPRLDETDAEILHEEDLRHLRNKIRIKGKTISLWPAMAKVAAVILVGLAFIYFLDPTSPDQQNGRLSMATGQEEVINTSSVAETILLPDSSLISLQPNSSIRFSKDDFNIRVRQVTLMGKASFAVSRDETRPFSVISYDVITTVLGTTFTIEAPSDNEKITVAVHSGRVAVTHRQANNKANDQPNEIIVTPNQQVVFDPDKKDLTALLVPRPIPLHKTKTSKVIFDEEPIANILLEIQEVFGVEIEYDAHALRDCRITTAFSNEGLYERLDLLKKAIGATYRAEGTKIKFQSDGCSTH